MISKKARKDVKCGKGTKDDHKKCPLSLIDPYFIEALAWHMQKGLKKYKRGNWQLDLEPERIHNANGRHWNAISKGEVRDKETGSNHSIAQAANSMMLYYAERHGNRVRTEHEKG